MAGNTGHIGGQAAPASGRCLTIATAGLISGVLTIAMACAFSALIFAGPLSGYVSTGISLILFGAFVLGTVTALTSSYAGTVARPHEIPAAIVAIIAASIAGRMAAGASDAAVFATVVAAIFVASCATGIFFLVLGYLNLGNLIRFVPYPVIGGFLAGTGLLLVKGAFGVMTDRALTMENMTYLASSGLLAKWLPGLAFALILFFILRWRDHYLVMPVWLTVSCKIAFPPGLTVSVCNICSVSWGAPMRWCVLPGAGWSWGKRIRGGFSRFCSMAIRPGVRCSAAAWRVAMSWPGAGGIAGCCSIPDTAAWIGGITLNG